MKALYPLVLGVCLSVTLAPAQTVVLDNFDSGQVRRNGYGDFLWKALEGTHALENGTYKSVGSSGGACSGNTCGHYSTFMPYPYEHPSGFLKGNIISGTWNPAINRLRFRVKCDRTFQRNGDGSYHTAYIDFGTYVKQPNAAGGNNQGQHYYHSHNPNIYANKWLVVDINGTPSHRVGGDSTINWPNEPELVDPTTGAPVRYFDGMTRFYFWDTNRGSDFAGSVCYFDDFELFVQPNEPDEYVYSTTLTHSGSAYEATWSVPKNMQVNYEVRSSTTSMKSAGWSSGTPRGTFSNQQSYGYSWNVFASFTAPEVPVMYIGIRPKMNVTAANSTIQLTTGVGHGLKTGDQVQVENVCPAANGLRTVTVVDRTRFTIGVISGCSYSGGGTVTATSNTSNFTEIVIRSGSSAPPVSPCDTNGDGQINETDINLARSAALGSGACTADLDSNGRCDVVDLQRVVNASLGQACRTN